MHMRCFAQVFFCFTITSITAIDPLPVIIWHGMGDHAKGGGIVELGETVKKIIPGTQVKCIATSSNDVEDIRDGYFKPINQQIAEVCNSLLNDPVFHDGVHMIGLSQGGLFVRALAQRCPFKRLGSIISIGGPQMGVFGVPKCRDLGPLHWCIVMEKLLSYGAYNSFIQNHCTHSIICSLVQAQYWHDPLREEVYRETSAFLSDINQEKFINSTYRSNLLKVKHLVLVQFKEDTVLKPKESEWFGYYDAMSTTKLHNLTDTAMYTEDWLGLKELAQSNRLHFIEVPGDHLQFTLEWFENMINEYIV